MRPHRFLLLHVMASLSVFHACSEKTIPAGDNELAVIRASINNSGNEFSISWEQDDQIAVLSAGILYQYRTDRPETGLFKHVGETACNTDDCIAVYPYDMISYNDGNLQLDFPDIMDYSDSPAIPMAARYTSGIMTFTPLCSIVRIMITGDGPVQSVYLTAASGENISGLQTLNQNNLTLSEVAGKSSPDITINCHGQVVLSQTPAEFQFAIPPQLYADGFIVTIQYADGKNFQAEYPGLTIAREGYYLDLGETDARQPDLSTFTATFIDSEIPVSWQPGDKIALISENKAYQYVYQGEDAGKAVFQASAEEIPESETYNAVYPYDAAIVSAEGIDLILDKENDYPVPGTQTLPMAASSSDMEFAFEHIFAQARLEVKGDMILKSIELSGNGGEIISGTATMDFENDKALLSGENITVINFPDGLQLDDEKPVTLTFNVPAQTYSKGFTVTATNDDGEKFTSELPDIANISKGQVHALGVIEFFDTPSSYTIKLDFIKNIDEISLKAEQNNPFSNWGWVSKNNKTEEHESSAEYIGDGVSHTFKFHMVPLNGNNAMVCLGGSTPPYFQIGRGKGSYIELPGITDMSLVQIKAYAFSNYSRPLVEIQDTDGTIVSGGEAQQIPLEYDTSIVTEQETVYTLSSTAPGTPYRMVTANDQFLMMSHLILIYEPAD